MSCDQRGVRETILYSFRSISDLYLTFVITDEILKYEIISYCIYADIKRTMVFKLLKC